MVAKRPPNGRARVHLSPAARAQRFHHSGTSSRSGSAHQLKGRRFDLVYTLVALLVVQVSLFWRPF